MPGRVVTKPSGIQSAAGPAIAVVTANTRVKGATGRVGTALDVVMFPNTPYVTSIFGLWIVPNTRVVVSGVPTVGATSQGLTFGMFGPYPVTLGPMFASTPDPKLKNT